MGSDQCCSRLDTFEIKTLISGKLGKKADTYFNQLGRFLTSRITKSEFDNICIKTIGRENISLHNRLIRSILKNASVSKSPPPRYLKKAGNRKSQPLYENAAYPPVYRQCRSRRLRDRFSPLGPLGKPQSITTTNGESISKLQKPQVEVISVEDGEEVEKPTESPGVQSRSPKTAPFNLKSNAGKSIVDSPVCSNVKNSQRSGFQPDTSVQSRSLLTDPFGVSFDLKSNAGKSIFDSSVCSNVKACQSSGYQPDTSVQRQSPLTAPFGGSFDLKSNNGKSVFDSSVCSNPRICQRSGFQPDTSVQRRSPLTAPFGVSFDLKTNSGNSIFNSSVCTNARICQNSGFQPDTSVQSQSPLTAPSGVSFDLKRNSGKSIFDLPAGCSNVKTCQSSGYLYDASVQTRSPITAPFGVSFNHKSKGKKSFFDSSVCSNGETCQSSSYLPDTATLRNRLEKKLEMEGMKLSMDSANLLNNGLNAYIRRLIEPCSNLSNPQRVSMSDFRAAMESNPWILGENWPMQLEKICFRDSEK